MCVPEGGRYSSDFGASGGISSSGQLLAAREPGWGAVPLPRRARARMPLAWGCWDVRGWPGMFLMPRHSCDHLSGVLPNASAARGRCCVLALGLQPREARRAEGAPHTFVLERGLGAWAGGAPCAAGTAGAWCAGEQGGNTQSGWRRGAGPA